jgi:hypothetical protein
MDNVVLKKELKKYIKSKKDKIRYQKKKHDLLDALNEKYHNEGGKYKQRIYVKNNKISTALYQKTYYDKHKVLVNKPKITSVERSKIYRDTFREKINEDARNKYKDNRDKFLLKSKIQYEKKKLRSCNTK